MNVSRNRRSDFHDLYLFNDEPPPKVKIVEHIATPPLVANCSKTSLQCLVSSPSLSSVLVWWTFRGENASKLPSAYVSKTSPNEWKLSLECATLAHSGTYACHSSLSNETHRAHRKEAVIQVYVPVSIREIPNSGIVRDKIGQDVTIKCLVTAYPKTTINWSKWEISDHNNHDLIQITPNKRVNIGFNIIDETTQEGSLMISDLIASDNGTYVCHAKNEYNNQSEASINLVVIQRPIISFDDIETLSSKSAQLNWNVISDGNDSIKRFILKMKNYLNNSMINTGVYNNTSEWMMIDSDIKPKYRGSYIVQYLAPAVTYGFHLAAVNSAGQSDWAGINVTMPSDVPAKITDLKILAATNETLFIGWKRPHDNGAHISDYQMELMNVKESTIIEETMNIKDGSQELRNNYMYIFVGLQPATQYKFHVKACSHLGCGVWSEPTLEGHTSDGHSDPPKNVKLICRYDTIKNSNYADISWKPTDIPRGTVIGYNITLNGEATYRNRNNQFVTDRLIEWHQISNNRTHILNGIPLKANTNYTVHVCAINLAGCGSWSSNTVTSSGSNHLTSCRTHPVLPQSLPPIKYEQTDTLGQLKLIIPRLSERLGTITCYKIYVIKLPSDMIISDLPLNASLLNITSYSYVHYKDMHHQSGVYLADEISSDHFNGEVIIGDGNYSSCKTENQKDSTIIKKPVYSLGEGIVSNTSISLSDIRLMDDGPLAESTNYSGFVEIHVLGTNGAILTKQSAYLSPMHTASIPLLSLPTATNAVSPLLVTIANTDTTILLCIVSAFVFIAFVMTFILWFLCRKRDGHFRTINVDDGTSDGFTTLQGKHVHSNGIVPNGYTTATMDHSNQYLPPVMPFHVSELIHLYHERHANSDYLFQLEFSSLPLLFHDRTTHDDNDIDIDNSDCGKNRSHNGKCFDQTRVRLTSIDQSSDSDYLNANFVSYGDKLYICTQGPVENTVIDFWRMIYEYECSIIVMLTACEEQGIVKCAQYWSDEGTKDIGHLFTVDIKSIRIFPDYIVRQFQITSKNSNKETREILQFHFTMWRDITTPELPSRILRFIKHVNENYCPDKGPLVVHCCSGIGRSGTYIAIDSLLPEIISEYVNIYECALNLRYQRYHLVQTYKQYVFIYRVILEYAIFGDTEVDIDHYFDYYHQIFECKIDNLSIINAQFNRLLLEIDDPKSCDYALVPDNVDKNRNIRVIPYDINRVILPSNDNDESPYINASLFQGYDRRLSFIVTQHPLTTTVNEFWCMIYEHNVTSMVMLSQIDDSDKLNYYWPCDEYNFMNYTVRMVQENVNCNNNYITRQFQVSKSIDTPHIVTQYHLLSWNNKQIIPESTHSLIALCENLLVCHDTCSPIVIHCVDGSESSGVCLSLLSLLYQNKVDKRLDVFQTVRFTILERSGIALSLEQYEFIYRALMDYIESRNLCNSGDVVL